MFTVILKFQWTCFLEDQNLVVVQDGVQSVGDGNDGAENKTTNCDGCLQYTDFIAKAISYLMRLFLFLFLSCDH
jgi:hypothetical protein